tara:strand:- start:845 stop:1231 length:387 start_codon:yes stop_codon:yes gene_type:complete
MKKILLVLLSFAVIGFINLINLQHNIHYFLAAIFYFLMFIFLFRSKSISIMAYAYIHLFSLAACVNMIVPAGFYAVEYIAYNAYFSFFSLVLAYEILLIMDGLHDELSLLLGRLNDRSVHSDDHKGVY